MTEWSSPDLKNNGILDIDYYNELVFKCFEKYMREQNLYKLTIKTSREGIIMIQQENTIQNKINCRHDTECVNYNCHFLHSKDRRECCEDGHLCPDKKLCGKLHPKYENYYQPCKYVHNCKRFGCKNLHSHRRTPECNIDREIASKCKDPNCKLLHPM